MTDPAAARAKAEPTPEASEGLVDDLRAEFDQGHFIDWECVVPYFALRTAAVAHVGDPDDRARSYNDGFDEALRQYGIDPAASPVAESPAEPERTDLRAAVRDAIDTVPVAAAATYVAGHPCSEDMVDHVMRGIASTLAAASPSSDTRPEAWWRCGRGHIFVRDPEVNDPGQAGFGYWVPTYCFVEDYDGNPCLDSAHLLGPFPTPLAALASPPEPPAKEPGT